MTSWAYLAAILASSGCMLLLDHRFRLYLFRDLRKALTVQAIGVGVLLVWDLICISLGVFARGEGPYLSGYEIVPHLTIEEPFFLWFLCHLTMVVATGASRLLDARQTRAARVSGGASTDPVTGAGTGTPGTPGSRGAA